ncbi:ComF family protein [Dokdonella sp.]|uniref:ComF family protein n=1 Tax=Dokdonella sp. TaxID=2291710 RepID=UPI002F3E57C0
MGIARAVDGWLDRTLRVVLPPRCVLCGGRGAGGRDLCAGCAADLAPNAPCCPCCALPLATPAPACGACLARAPPFDLAWVPLRYGHPLDLLEARFKFHGDLAAGRVLAECLVECATRGRPALPALLVPIPLHTARLRERGYNQALELARPLARALDVPLRHDLLVRPRATPAQTGLDAKMRRRNLRGAFAVAPGFAWPGHVALFDDVMTTGATLREAARTLKRAGVARVDAWALARAPRR